MATLQIDFTVPTPTPVNGFIVKYRKVGTTPYTTVFPNPTTSPVIITIPSLDSYEGTIQSDCGNSSTSPVTNFVAYASTQISAPVGSTPTEACSGASVLTLYVKSNFPTIAPGVVVYTDPALTIPYTAGGYIVGGTGYIYTINTSGLVTGNTGNVCGQAFTSFAAGAGIGGSDQVSAACASSASFVKYMAAGDTLQVGTATYMNSALTIPAGPFSYKIPGNQVATTNSSGVITNITTC